MLVDVSHVVEHGMITYKGLPAPLVCDFLSREQSRSHYAPGTEFHIGKIEMVANTGTYLDSPFHRYANGKDLSELPLERLASLEGVVISADPSNGRAVSRAAFKDHDLRGKAVLVRTGWDAHWRTDQYFEGHPFLTKDAAEYLLESGVALVGIDSLNIDDTADLSRPVHSLLLAAEGGFAQVWKGFDLDLRRAVAVKVPKQGRLVSAERFMAEARRVAGLKHPGVVPVFDVGRDGDSCFIVSEFVEGGTLAERIAKDRPTTQESARLIAEVAETLAYAHRQGFVHRDIKPANILLDHHGRALLADFGIAFSPDDKGEGGSFGTLAYMSPEQVEGKALDHRSDNYSLGVVLYELLTGHLPHEATDPVELRRQIVAGTVARIPGISTAGDTICRKCLSQNPADRYQDAAQLAHDLRRKTFTVRPASTKNRLLALGAVVLLGLAGFFVVWGVLDRVQSPGVETRTTLASERRAVEWVYSVGGFVNDTKRLDQLAEPWAVRSVYLHRDHCADRVDDGNLAQLEGLPDLDTLNLGGAKIDGSGLAHLRESKKLTWLSLECTQVDDAGLTNLASFPELTYLNLLSTPITDASVDVLLKLPRLEMVVVSGTKLTEAGIKRLQNGLPGCRVQR